MAAMNGAQIAGRNIKVGRPSGMPGAGAMPMLPLLGNAFNPALMPQAASLLHAGLPTPSPILPTPAAAAPAVATGAGGVNGAAAVHALAAAGVGIPGVATAASPNAAAAAAAAAAALSSMEKPQSNARIYVGSLAWELTADNIKSVFEAFGKVRSCDLIPNPETGKHRGYGFIEFEDEKAASDAIDNMNNFELMGRKLRVGRAHSTMSGPPPATASNAAPSGSGASQELLAQAQARMAALGAIGSSGNAALPDTLSAQEDVQITADQRVALMRKLANRDKTRVLLLTNMVGPAEVDNDLKPEVFEECSQFGKVENVTIHTNKEKQAVYIFVYFESVDGAAKARDSLDRRFFGGRVIGASFYDERKFLECDYSGV